jgi:hypothetical protein
MTSAKLDAGVEASGPHDFTVRVSTIRQARRRVHRIPLPTSVTIASRPSKGNETAGVIEVFLPNREAENFCKWGWTGESVNRAFPQNLMASGVNSVIASAAMQSIPTSWKTGLFRRFAPRNDVVDRTSLPKA